MWLEDPRPPLTQAPTRPLVDQYGRRVTYLRMSVTDRCDLRCTYCMSETMTFMPRDEVLSLEEMARLGALFIARGVRKIRLTGGEPLVRRNVLSLVEALSAHLGDGLDELTLTTNGTLMNRFAKPLFAAGIRRVNISLDTLNAERYARTTRIGRIGPVLDGIEAALSAGLKVKINAVAQRDIPLEETFELIEFGHRRGMDVTLIEEMPLGETGHARLDSHLPLNELRDSLGQRWTLQPLRESTGGPARYVRVGETGGRLGFITPLSCGFCALCNRVRLSASGQFYTCMGDEGSVDLRQALRQHGPDGIMERIEAALSVKPEGHRFAIGAGHVEGIGRHMSALGG